MSENTIYIIEGNVTVEIHIQGGIVAANGITGIFMVHSVMAVSAVDKLKRDANKAANHNFSGKKEKSLFAEILSQTVEEQKAPRECHTLTYGQDSRLHSFQYQQREYRY